MQPSEKLLYAINTNMSVVLNSDKLKVDPMNVKNKTNGVFCVTNQRIFFCSSILGQKLFKEIRLQDITSVEKASNLPIAFATGSKIKISGITASFIIDTHKKNSTELIELLSQLKQLHSPLL